MALIRDIVYYKDISTKGDWSFRLYFIPADNTNLTVELDDNLFEANGIKEMPDFIIGDSLTVDIGYDGNIPLGIPLSGEMEINMRFDLLRDQGTDDWTTFRNWIAQGTNGTRSVTSVGNVTMRNCWMIKSNDGDGTTNYDTVEYIGVQLPTPERRPKIGKDGQVNFQIKCLDIFRAALEETSIDSVATDIDLVDLGVAVQRMYYLYYEKSAGKYNSFYRKLGATNKMKTMTNLLDSILTVSTDIISALTRTTWTVNASPDKLLRTLVLYEQTNNKTALIGSQITTGNETFIKSIVISAPVAGILVAGMLADTKSDNSFYEHENWWDALNFWKLSMFAKGYFNVNLTKGTSIVPEIGIKKVFETTKGDGLTITKSDMINEEIEYTEGHFVVKEGFIHFADLPGEQQNEFTVSATGVRWSSEQFEAEPTMHNMIPRADHKTATGGRFIFRPEYALIRNICYSDTIGGSTVARRVHDWFKIDLGDGTFIEGEDITGDDLPTVDDYARSELNNWIEDRHLISGHGYILGKAALNTFGGEFQSLVPCKLSIEKALPRHLGDIYTIDVDALYPFTINTNIDTAADNAVLVSVKANFYTQQSECEFFIRGDR